MPLGEYRSGRGPKADFVIMDEIDLVESYVSECGDDLITSRNAREADRGRALAKQELQKIRARRVRDFVIETLQDAPRKADWKIYYDPQSGWLCGLDSDGILIPLKHLKTIGVALDGALKDETVQVNPSNQISIGFDPASDYREAYIASYIQNKFPPEFIGFDAV